jgi:hypothetical protein
MINIDAYTYEPAAHKYFQLQQANKYIPDWFKKVPTSFMAPIVDDMHIERPTMKQCVGLTDLYNKGFMIPLWSDVVIETNEISCRYAYADGESKLDQHAPQQMGQLTYGNIHGKLLNPWKLKTDSDVDFLWSQPSYNLHEHFRKFHVLPGIVNYKHQHATHINIMMQPNTRIELEAGTPLAHIIPLTDEKVTITHHLVTQQDWDAMAVYPAWKNRYAKGKKANVS